MIREHIFAKRAAADPMFRWRGGGISRLEGFSDGVFALTLTLLIVSVTPPATFYALFGLVRNLPVFLVSFAMLMMAWHYHYIFFRRYGLEDFLTSLLNAAFLFLILFFAYPLRFLASFLWALVLGDPTDPLFEIPAGVEWAYDDAFQRGWMMYFYGFGIIGVFGLLALMVARAYSKRDELELDRLERHLTVTAFVHHMMTVTVAIASVTILALGAQAGYGGVVYFLLAPMHGMFGWLSGRRAKSIRLELDAAG